MINFIAMLICLWAMKTNIEQEQMGWATVAGFCAVFNAVLLFLNA